MCLLDVKHVILQSLSAPATEAIVETVRVTGKHAHITLEIGTSILIDTL